MQDKSSWAKEGFKYASENPRTFGMVFLGTAALLGTFGYFAYQRTDDLKSFKITGVGEMEKKERIQKMGNIEGQNINAEQYDRNNKLDVQEIGNVKGTENVNIKQW